MTPAYSMTGYGRSQVETSDFSLTVTAKSVNHRFLDVQLRLPAEFDPLEIEIRRIVKKEVRRGQVQISAHLRWTAPAGKVSVDRDVLDAYLETYRDVARAHSIEAEPDLMAAMRLPGVAGVERSPEEEDALTPVREAAIACLGEALQQLKASRAEEAAGTVEEIRQRGTVIRDRVGSIREAVRGVVPKLQEKLAKRLSDLLADTAVEPQRLLQESALLADRADISEELQRLASHAERLDDLLDGGGELGKRLDHLAQEMNREANTVLSKCSPLGPDALAVTEAGLAIRSEIEKIREQAQNLE